MTPSAMAVPSFILFPGSTTWRIGVVRDGQVALTAIAVPANTSHDQTAALVAVALNGAGYEGQGTILALPSAWCFSASIGTADLRRHDRKAMLFRLEEKLPLAAEALIADFIPHHSAAASSSTPSSALGICVRIETV